MAEESKKSSFNEEKLGAIFLGVIIY